MGQSSTFMTSIEYIKAIMYYYKEDKENKDYTGWILISDITRLKDESKHNDVIAEAIEYLKVLGYTTNQTKKFIYFKKENMKKFPIKVVQNFAYLVLTSKQAEQLNALDITEIYELYEDGTESLVGLYDVIESSRTYGIPMGNVFGKTDNCIFSDGSNIYLKVASNSLFFACGLFFVYQREQHNEEMITQVHRMADFRSDMITYIYVNNASFTIE